MGETVFRVIGEIRCEVVTVLTVEQNAALALRMTDRVYVTESGRIAVEGAARNLLDSAEIRRARVGG
jgi:branched-chain amino acid transport system ATP-binding protein